MVFVVKDSIVIFRKIKTILILISFGSKLYRQIVVIPMGTNCTPLVADLFFVLS